MLRILFDHEIFSEQRYGGISRYFKYVMDGISATDDIVYKLGIISSDNQYIRNEKHLLRNPTFNFFSSKRKELKRNNSYCTRLVKENNFSVLHPTYFNPYLLKYLKKPLVLTVHDMTYEALPHLFPESDPTPYFKRLMMQKADVVIAISEATKQDILKYTNIKEAKITVIHHGIDANLNNYQEVNGLPKDYILFVGGRWHYKNFFLLIDAFEMLSADYPKLKLVLAGGGELGFGETEYILRKKLTDKVIYYSPNDGQLNTLYKNATCFVYPSRYEGFGLPILEAFKNNCPVVLSDINCFKEVAGDAALYFSATDSQEMITQIKTIINNQKLSRELVIAGRKQLELFGLDKCIDKTIAVYRSLA